MVHARVATIVALAVDPADGCIPVPQGPGLGVELDEEKIAHYAAAR